MLRNKKFVIVYAVVVFLIVFLIAFNSVCSISQFEVAFEVQSMAWQAKSIQDRLEDEYRGKSYLFFKEADVTAIVAEESGGYMEVTSFSKRFPNKVSVSVREKPETFAFRLGSGEETRYVVVADDGTVLAVRGSLASNVGGSNVEILGFDFALPAVGDAFAVSDNQAPAYASLQTVFSVMQKKLGSFRDNIVSVEYAAAQPGIEYSPSLFKIQTREGVRIVILMPETDMDTKIRAAIDVYQGTGDYTTDGGGTISDEDRTRGSIVVYASGTVAYTERDVDGVEDLPQSA